MASRVPVNTLKSVDLPTLGRPTSAMTGSTFNTQREKRLTAEAVFPPRVTVPAQAAGRARKPTMCPARAAGPQTPPQARDPQRIRVRPRRLAPRPRLLTRQLVQAQELLAKRARVSAQHARA